MQNINNSIRCDVVKCKHNVKGCNCALGQIKVTCDCTDCTCCGSFTSQNVDD